MEPIKNKISNVFFVLSAGGAIYLVLAGLIRTDGKKYLNSREGYFIFAGFIICALVGGLISGTIGAKGIPISKAENPASYWIIIALNLLIATFFLVSGINR